MLGVLKGLRLRGCGGRDVLGLREFWLVPRVRYFCVFVFVGKYFEYM